MILGDSLVVMNSLLHYEGLGGQVQCIYMDPPHGVKFGSKSSNQSDDGDIAHWRNDHSNCNKPYDATGRFDFVFGNASFTCHVEK
jgi:hypothetical protein